MHTPEEVEQNVKALKPAPLDVNFTGPVYVKIECNLTEMKNDSP